MSLLRAAYRMQSTRRGGLPARYGLGRRTSRIGRRTARPQNVRASNRPSLKRLGL